MHNLKSAFDQWGLTDDLVARPSQEQTLLIRWARLLSCEGKTAWLEFHSYRM